MREIYYYLLFGACLYFVLTRVLKYYVDNNQQENFDPSLVPVSSIVTLAN